MDFKPYRGNGGLNLSIDMPGVNQVQAGLTSLPTNMNDFIRPAMDNWANEVLTRAKALVPSRTGRLRDSGQVLPTEMKGGALQVGIGFGDRKKVWYASIVHERMDVRHPTGQAKFLETPLNENLKLLELALAEAIQVALGRV